MGQKLQQILDFDIDHYLNRYIPHSRLDRLPKPISRFLGYRTEYKEAPRLVIVFWSFLGSLLSLLIIGALFRYAPAISKWHPPVMIASLGASAILDYNAIRTPLAQPRNAILGQTLSATIGVGVNLLFKLSPNYAELQWVAGALACALAAAAMSLTNSVHPPGGASAVLAATNAEVIAMGWNYVPALLLSSCVMLALACLLNNISRAYPAYWWTSADLRETPQSLDLETVVSKSSFGSEKVLRGCSVAAGDGGVEIDGGVDAAVVVVSAVHVGVPPAFDLDADEVAVLARLQARLRWDLAVDGRPVPLAH